ncbi:hypothetical protein HDV05_007065 [Chytridiales sp. JEL 0842]|nr:hypothetical protein HDV05_007065 [Chytridiales sp. JEL 0842]
MTSSAEPSPSADTPIPEGASKAPPMPKPADDDATTYINLTVDGGVRKKIVKEGDGIEIVDGSLVTVEYSGYLYPDGPLFDSSRERGRSFQFRVGREQVIFGWEIGLKSMKVGEHSELICESKYAYGQAGNGTTIPPNSTLIFEIEVLRCDPPEDPIPDKIQFAQEHKEKGNTLYRTAKYAEAAKAYSDAVSKLTYTWGADPHELETINSLKSSLYSNLAAAYLKVGDLMDAVQACENALEVDRKLVKVWFRLGQAKAGLAMFEQAVENLTTAMELDPSDASIPKEIEKVKKMEKDLAEKEKKMYKAMFK